MNASAELLVVAVPGGSVRPNAVLRGVVIPRLSGLDATANPAAYGLSDWPDLLGRSTVKISAATSPLSEAREVVGAVRRLAESPVWRAVFDGVLVKPWAPPGGYPDPHVIPSATDLKTVQKVYRTVAGDVGNPAVIGTQLQTVAGSTIPPLPAGEQGERTREEPDFHRLVTFYREHPAVLRALGLIIEIDIPDSRVLAELGTGVLAIHLTPPGDADAAIAPTPAWTRFEFDGERFLPAARIGSDIRRGLLDLSGSQWRVATFDVAATMDRLRLAKEKAGPGTATTLPAIRSTGLSLLRSGRNRQLRARNRNAEGNAVRRPAELELWADDLVLGYRVDVRSSATDWSSLCRRDADYATAGGELPIGGPHEEEGHVKAQGATFRGAGRADDEETKGLLADDTVVRWDGWSMACPHPDQTAARRRNPIAKPPRLSWEFDPIGVPDLRFGRTYRMRMRIADIAGGGLDVEAPEQFEGACGEEFYGRHDPVPPPELPPPPGLVEQQPDREPIVVPDALGPGGLIDVLVIRSDPGAPDGPLDVAQYAAAHPYRPNQERMLLPPPAPFILCHQAGTLDNDEKGNDLDDEAFATLLGRATMPPVFTASGGYSWLPDPHAEGVTLAALPGPALGTPPPVKPLREAWTVPDGEWPDYAAKHVHLRTRGPLEKTIDWPDGHTAVVRLAPAETVTVDVSSSVTSIEPFAMTNWLRSGVGGLPGIDDADFLNDLMDLVRLGRHPLVSPPRALRFVHAVQHPKDAPAGTLAAARKPGETFAMLADAKPENNPWFGLHAPSTAQLDVAASWSEWDPLAGEEPTSRRTHQVGSFSLDLAGTGLPDIRHEFGDTRHRKVDYTLTAVSRFTAFFDNLQPRDFAKEAAFTVSVPNTATPPVPVVPAVAPAFAWQVETEAGRYRKTRRGGLLRVELTPPWNLTGQREQLGVVVHQSSPLASRIRRDPIWATPLPGRLRPEDFPRATDVLTVKPAGSPEAVTVLAHDAHFQETPSRRWYADIEIDQPNESYNAFVDLAVVRLQQSSLAGCEASTVVRADAVQLLPDRALTCWIDATGIRVRLDGPGPAGSRSNVVRATLERLPAEFDPGLVEVTALGSQPDGIPAWRAVTSVRGPLGTDLPALARADQPSHCRLVVQEIEQYGSGVQETAGLGERTVFLDVVPLSTLIP